MYSLPLNTKKEIFQEQQKEIYLVGVNMISDQKELEDFLVEKI